MRNVLTHAGQQELLEFLRRDPLLVFDFDGTLCPIVEHAEQAALRPKTRHLLNELCVRSICVLLTGRSRQDAFSRVGQVSFAQVVGSHGSDWGVVREGDPTRKHSVAQWRLSLARSLQGLQGVEIEDKGLSLSVHYRRAHPKEPAIHAIEAAFKRLHGVRIVGGKQVYNVLPEDCEGKGRALHELKGIFGKREALYIGDDLTDEEVFELPASDPVFKIRVGHSLDSRAEYYLAGQSRIEDLLELLLHRTARSAVEDVA